MAGFNNDVVYGTNVDFTGTNPVSGQINLNGELLVGSTVAPFIRAYVPTGSNGLVVNTGPGTIDFNLVNIPNGALANSTITLNAGNGLSGGGGVSLGNSVSIALTTPVSVANGGTGAATLTGVMIGNGASAVTANAVTQHDVLVGGTSNAITSVAPSATSGIPLVSNGASADPSFTTAVVAGGGTGVATFANTSALIATGTTSTGAVQNIASVASGQVLTSAGTSTLAAWSATPSLTSVTFGAGTALSVYQEGTWTPTIIGSSSAGTSTYTAQNGYYTKVGNLVTLIAVVAVSAQTGTGNISAAGFPFTIKSQTNGNPIGPLDFNGAGYTWTAGYTYFTLQGTINGTNGTPILNGSLKGATAFGIANTALTLDYNISFQV